MQSITRPNCVFCALEADSATKALSFVLLLFFRFLRLFLRCLNMFTNLKLVSRDLNPLNCATIHFTNCPPTERKIREKLFLKVIGLENVLNFIKRFFHFFCFKLHFLLFLQYLHSNYAQTFSFLRRILI